MLLNKSLCDWSFLLLINFILQDKINFLNPMKTVTLSVDTSSYGIGAVILQDRHPLEYNSAAAGTKIKRSC